MFAFLNWQLLRVQGPALLLWQLVAFKQLFVGVFSGSWYLASVQ